LVRFHFKVYICEISTFHDVCGRNDVATVMQEPSAVVAFCYYTRHTPGQFWEEVLWCHV